MSNPLLFTLSKILFHFNGHNSFSRGSICPFLKNAWIWISRILFLSPISHLVFLSTLLTHLLYVMFLTVVNLTFQDVWFGYCLHQLPLLMVHILPCCAVWDCELIFCDALSSRVLGGVEQMCTSTGAVICCCQVPRVDPRWLEFDVLASVLQTTQVV